MNAVGIDVSKSKSMVAIIVNNIICFIWMHLTINHSSWRDGVKFFL